ncbi:MAG: AAA family ATPase [Bacteroidia bacterium]|nr:AAA family ATPase [Bacteroidia bacterium]
MFARKHCSILASRIKEERRFIQVVMGPRQVGKSTMVKQVLSETDIPFLRFTADNVPATNIAWISQCWDSARARMKVESLTELILVIDEVQKIKGWSEVVKKEWDDDSFNDVNIKVILLGSSRVLLDKGLADSLAGRFERIIMSHWDYSEFREAFGWDIDKFIYYGAYPGAAPLIDDPERWLQYISGSIIDATINKDILIDTPVNKPALLRQTFELSCAYSSQELSLTKMMGQMTDAGNTTTIASYLNLLDQAGLVCGLGKFSNDEARKRASVPKHQVFNNALKAAYAAKNFSEAYKDRKYWGRVFESAVGAHIAGHAYEGGYRVWYWRDYDGNEVDYVLEKKGALVAIEVKSNQDKSNAGLVAFERCFHPGMSFVVGEGGMPVETFLSCNPEDLF